MTDEDQLLAWLDSDLGIHAAIVPRRGKLSLVQEAKWCISRALSRPNPMRPSKRAEKLRAFSKKLAKAASAAAELDDAALEAILTSAGSTDDAASAALVRHVLYLQSLALWADDAAEATTQMSHSMGNDRGGPDREERLREVIATLMLCYIRDLGIRPTLTIDPGSHLAERGLAGFVKEALRLFAPQGVHFEPGLVDSIVREKLPIRELEEFLPPRLPSGLV